MINLIDIYCLFNRARGTGTVFIKLNMLFSFHVRIRFTFLIISQSIWKAKVLIYLLFITELISPDDLLQACSLWEKFDVYVKKNNLCVVRSFSMRVI